MHWEIKMEVLISCFIVQERWGRHSSIGDGKWLRLYYETLRTIFHLYKFFFSEKTRINTGVTRPTKQKLSIANEIRVNNS